MRMTVPTAAAAHIMNAAAQKNVIANAIMSASFAVLIVT